MPNSDARFTVVRCDRLILNGTDITDTVLDNAEETPDPPQPGLRDYSASVLSCRRLIVGNKDVTASVLDGAGGTDTDSSSSGNSDARFSTIVCNRIIVQNLEVTDTIGVDAAYDPLEMPGLIALYDEQSSRWQDTAGTTAATAAGHVVRRWDDRYGGYHLINASTGFTLGSQGGELGVKSATSTTNMLSATIADHSAGDFAIHTLSSVDSSASTQRGFMLFESSVVSSRMPHRSTIGNHQFGTDSNGRSPWFNDGSVYHSCWTRSGSTLSHYINGTLVDTYTWATSWTMNRIIYGDSAFGLAATAQAIAVCVQAHSAQDVADYYAYLRETRPGSFPKKTNLWCLLSNSLGGNTYVQTPSQTLAHKASALMSTSAAFVNVSVGGKNTPQMTADVAARVVAPMLASGADGGKRVYLIWECTNDMATNGVSGAQAATNLWTLVSTLKTADPGARVVVITVIDRNAATWTTRKPACNAAILSDYAVNGVNAVVDLTGVTTLSADGANASSTYFVDNVHLKAAGYDEMDDLTAAGLDAGFA